MGAAAASGPQRARGDSLAAWIISAALAALAVAFHIRQSLEAGALALPPTYDDVGYFLDAAARLEILREGGLSPFLREYAAQPPHAPLSTFLAMIGFAAFGFEPWAACAANAIPLALLLRGFFAVAKGLPLWLASVVAVALLGSHIVGIAAVEFRPDAFAGLAIAVGAMFIVLSDWQRGRTGPGVAGGGFLALALWAKPSMFLVTIAVFGAAMLAASIPDIFHRATRRGVVRAWVATIVAAALFAAPYYAFALADTVRYVLHNLFGEQSHIWDLKISTVEHLLYYLVGIGGDFTLGGWLYLALSSAPAGLVLLVRRRAIEALRKCMRVGAVLLVCYAVLTIPAHKSPFIGISITAFVMVAIALGAVFVLQRLLHAGRRRAALLIAAALSAFSALEFRTPWAGHHAAPVSGDFAEAKHRMLAETVDTIRREFRPSAVVLLTAISHYLNFANVSFASVQRHGAPITAIDLHRHGSIPDYRAALLRADAALAFAPDADAITWLPSAALRAQFLKDLESDPKWVLVRTIADDKPHGPVYVFRRRRVPSPASE